MDIAVEGRTDDLAGGIDHGRARVAADDVVGRGEIIDRPRVDPGLVVEEGLGRIERLGTRGPLIQAAHIGEGRHGDAAIAPALDPAVGQAQREGRVRILVGAIDREPGLGDLFGRTGGRRVDLGGPARADRGCGGVIGDDEGQQGIGGGHLFRGHGGGLGAEGGLTHPGRRDQPVGQGFGALAAQQGLHLGMVDRQIFAGLGQPVAQTDFLHLHGDRRLGPDGGDHAPALRLGHRRVLRCPHDGPGHLVQGRTAAGGLVQLAGRQEQLTRRRLHPFQVRPGVTDLLHQGRIGGHAGAQLGLGVTPRAEEGRVQQGLMLAVLGLEAVLEAEDRVERQPLGLVAGQRILQQTSAQFRVLDQRQRQLLVAQPLQLAHRQQARGRAGVAGHEDRVAFRRGVGIPAQEAGALNGPAILIGAQETGIEGVAREVEIVRVPTEEGRLVLGGEHQPDVVIAAEFVQGVAATAVEADDLTVEFRITGAGLGLDRIGLGGAGRIEGRAFESGTGPQHPVGHIYDVDQHLGGLSRAALLFLAVGGQEAVFHIVLLGRGQLLHAADDTVPVGQDQALIRHERGRAALDADGGIADPVQPGLVDPGAVFVIHRLDREIVEGPHAFIGAGRGRRGHHGQKAGDGGNRGGRRHGGAERAKHHSANSPGVSAGVADRCSLHRHDERFSSIATLPVLQIRNGDRLNQI